MIDYRNYHASPLFISNKEGTDFEGLSFKTIRNIYRPYHFHDGAEIVYVHQGAILVKAFSLAETVKEGQFIPCDPYLVHSIESMTPDTVVTTISISGVYIDEKDGLISSNVHLVSDTEEYARLKEDILEWIMMTAMPDATTDKMLWQMKKIFPRLQKFMSVAFLDTKEDRAVVEGSEKDHERLTSIFNYLFYHHDETIRLDSISSELYISKYYLSHYIKRTFGYTLKQALFYCRTEESVIDLLGDQLTIAEVAAKHGFPSVRSYNEAFPRYFGVSPAEYRRRHQKETVQHKDFAGEEVSLDFLRRETAEGSTIHLDGCSVTVNLPKGTYEVLSVETEKNNINNHITRLNTKNKIITMDSDCEELILRIKRQ